MAQTTKANLTDVVLFDAEGVAAEKDYAYVLGRTSSSSGYVTLNVLLMDGTASHEMFERCIKKGLMIRDCSSFEGLDGEYIRFCFRKAEENNALLDTLLHK